MHCPTNSLVLAHRVLRPTYLIQHGSGRVIAWTGPIRHSTTSGPGYTPPDLSFLPAVQAFVSRALDSNNPISTRAKHATKVPHPPPKWTDAPKLTYPNAMARIPGFFFLRPRVPGMQPYLDYL